MLFIPPSVCCFPYPLSFLSGFIFGGDSFTLNADTVILFVCTHHALLYSGEYEVLRVLRSCGHCRIPEILARGNHLTLGCSQRGH